MELDRPHLGRLDDARVLPLPQVIRLQGIATLMLYVDEHDRQRTQQTLADLVASTVTTDTTGSK